MTETTEIERSYVYKLAAESCTDPRTVLRFLKGQIVKGLLKERLEKAKARLDAAMKGAP